MEIFDIKISVILAVYNGELYLKEAIDSILAQTFKDFELIVINDGSVDSTSEIVSQYNDKRIISVDNQINKGLVYSLNRGLFLSKGKYIARMDSDDIALPQRLKVQFDYMEMHPHTGICGSCVGLFYGKSRKRKIIRFPTRDIDIRAFAFFQSPFCHPSVMMRREVLDIVNLQYPNVSGTEDYALWITLLKYTEGSNIPSVLLYYRKHPLSESALFENKLEELNQSVCNIQREYLSSLGFILSLEEWKIYARFVNRTIRYSFLIGNQKTIEKILKQLVCHLFKNNKQLLYRVQYFLAEICFYRFFTCRKLPMTSFLQKLYWQGVIIYIKKFFRKNL